MISNAEISRHAKAAGLSLFMGSPCKRCGNQWRYVTGSQACLQCTKARNKAAREANQPRMTELQRNWRRANNEYYQSWRLNYHANGAKKKINYGEL